MQSFNISSAVKSSSPKSLSNEALIRNTHALVAEERRLTTEILWYLHEIQVRRLYAEKGFASLFEYAVQVFGYSEAAAGRRIAAMKLLVDIPEIEPALQRGEVSLSTLSTIQSFIQRKNQQSKDRKSNALPVSKSEKKELVLALRGKSRRECEKHLIALDPAAATPKERERVVSSTQTEIRFIADDELLKKFQKIKELDGHILSNPSYLEFFHRIADLVIKELDPSLRSRSSKTSSQASPAEITKPIATPKNSPKLTTPPAELTSANLFDGDQEAAQNSRYIPSELKRQIWKRDDGRCQFISADGKTCGSRFALEIDHIVPVAWDGKTELKNLQLLCRTHNCFKALSQLGPAVMQSHINLT
jgi:hypothetical protein